MRFKMKILVLSDTFPPTAPGGAGQIAFKLASAFLKKGHQVFVITTRQDKLIPEQEVFKGLKVFRIYSNYHERWRACLSLYNPQVVGRVRTLIKEIKPEVVYAHNIHYYLSYYCLKLAQKYSKGVFLTVHDMMLVYYGKWKPKSFNNFKITILDQIQEAKKRYNPFRNIIIRFLLKYVDKIFAVSCALAHVLNHNGIQNIEVLHNGIDVDNWKIKKEEIRQFKQQYNIQNKKVIFFGGRLSELKGGEKIIQVMKKVVEQIPETVLLIAGKKQGYAQKMLRFAQQLGISNNIVLTGWLDNNEIKSAYYSCEIVVVPSIYLDPFPTLNLEAMACKKPVVGTCFGGTPEIVEDGKTGYIVNPFNVGVVAEKIINLLRNPQKAKEFGELGYKRVKEKFSLQNQAEKYLDWSKKNNLLPET